MPFIAHEYLNLGIKMDPRIAPKPSGAIPAPRSLEAYEESLHAAGLDRAWGDACLDAAHALQAYYQKEGLERARLDPACDGYSYWTIVDVMVPQEGTYTGQGYMNAFWETKPGGLTPEAFRRFNGPTAILATFQPESAIAVSGEECTAAFRISHFDAAPLAQARLSWTVTAGGQTLASGATGAFDAAPGAVQDVGGCEFGVPELEAPVHAKLEVRLEGTEISNAWISGFSETRGTKGDGIAVTEDLHEALASRYRGIAVAHAGGRIGPARHRLVGPSCAARRGGPGDARTHDWAGRRRPQRPPGMVVAWQSVGHRVC